MKSDSEIFKNDFAKALNKNADLINDLYSIKDYCQILSNSLRWIASDHDEHPREAIEANCRLVMHVKDSLQKLIDKSELQSDA
jgi:hypothetical protein